VRRVAFSVEQIRTFIVVASSPSVTAAAKSLFLTQGAVTQQVRNFQRALRVPLIERDGRRLRLTEAGRAVAQACQAAARELEAIDDTARVHRTLDMGTLRIGSGPTCAAHHLPALLSAFTERHPGVEIAVTVGNSPTVADWVANGDLDCGLIEGPPENDRLEEWLIEEDELVVVVGSRHPLAKIKHATASELSRYRYLSREPGSALEHSAREMLGDAYSRASHLVLTNLDAVRAAVVEGLGFAVLPRVAISHELQDGSISLLPLPGSKRWIRAIRRRASQVPAVIEFWKLLPTAGAAQ